MKQRRTEDMPKHSTYETITDDEREILADMEPKVKPKRGRPKAKLSQIKKAFNYDRDSQARNVPVYGEADTLDGIAEGMTLLTPYEHAFCTHMLHSRTQAEAAQKAARPEDREKSINWAKRGWDLMQRDNVRKALGLMQKKLCIAAALDSTDVISNIREIAALATLNGKYEAALKANQMMAAYLGIDLGQAGARPGPKVVSEIPMTTLDIFKSGEELIDRSNDIKNLGKTLGFDISTLMGETDGTTPKDN